MNFQIMTVILILLTAIQPTMTMTMTQLQVDKIETNAGYTIIQDSNIFLPPSYNFSLHIIDLNQIETIITELKTSISILPKYLGNPLTMNIDKIEDKLKTISNGHHNINKRGLFNFLGRVNKWISGSMDDEDREIINQHFEITDTNNQQITNNFNEQIKIKENFNKSINNLYMSICEDRIIQTFIQNYTDIYTKRKHKTHRSNDEIRNKTKYSGNRSNYHKFARQYYFFKHKHYTPITFNT